MAIYYDSNQNKHFEKNIGNPTIKVSPQLTPISDITSYSIYYNYTLDTVFDTIYDNNIDNLFRIHYEESSLLMRPNKSQEIINIENLRFEAETNMLKFLAKENVSFSQIKNFFSPNNIKLSFRPETIYKENNYYGNINIIKEEVIKIIHFPFHDISKLQKKSLILLTKLYIIMETHRYFAYYSNVIKKDFKQLFANFGNKSSQLDELLNLITSKNLEVIFTDGLIYTIPKIKQSFNFLIYLEKQQDSFLIQDTLSLRNNEELLNNLPPWIDCNFIDKDGKTFFDLSYGQKFLITFLYDILYHVDSLVPYRQYKNIILMLDEVELGLHPNWQKEYVSLLIEVLKPYQDRFHFQIIVASHSPYIISDLPKENVIFLDTVKFKDDKTKKAYPKLNIKDLENGNSINVSKHIDINSFGANIHTLLSDGFFMKGGLMGEFAKKKIEDIISKLTIHKSEIAKPKGEQDSNNLINENEQKYIKSVILNIGEEFLKKKLFNMYFSLFDEKETQLKILEKEKARIEARIKKLL